MQNVLAEHEMSDRFGGGETSKQGQAVKTISCQANSVGQFRQALGVKSVQSALSDLKRPPPPPPNV